MKWYRSNGRVLTLMLALAFFNFIFLGIEYQFDNMMALVTGPEQVVTAQGYILGASVLGFLLYPAAASYIKEKFWQIVVFAGALAGVICVFVIWQHTSYGTILAAGCICFILIGMAGSAVHYYLSRAAAPEHLAKTIGISYAVGIFLQFLNNNLIKNDMAESVVLAVSAAVFSVLLLNAENGIVQAESDSESASESTLENSEHAGLWLILLIILITCIFSTLDAAVTLRHAAGSADVGQWPRLLLAAKTLFATHYHELTELEGTMEGVNNYCIAVKEKGDDIVFLRKIVKGGADKSYGIQVAKLAGVPDSVIARAKELVEELSQADISVKAKSIAEESQAKAKQKAKPKKYDEVDLEQISLFDAVKDDDVVKELQELDISNMTPMDAMNTLYRLQNKLKNRWQS